MNDGDQDISKGNDEVAERKEKPADGVASILGEMEEVPSASFSARDGKGSSKDIPSYATSLKHLAADFRRLGSVLEEAEVRRAAAVLRLTNDVRLKGANDLMVQLDRIATAFAAEPQLCKLTFLIRRVIADFETALEATLSSYTAVAFDAMRDVLEIEYLLRDFALNEELIDEWLNADERTIIKKFGPNRVRQRLKAAGIKGFGQNAQSADYKGHSQMLHPAPSRSPILPEKGRTPPDIFGSDIGFWEIFDHARGIWSAIAFLAGKIAPKSEANRLVVQEPTVVSAAWRDTSRARLLFQGIIEAGIKRQQGDKAAAAIILAKTLRDAGVLKGEDLKSDDPEEVLELVKRVSVVGEPSVRMAAMGLAKILDEPDDSEGE
jgi:hypothetical protein